MLRLLACSLAALGLGGCVAAGGEMPVEAVNPEGAEMVSAAQPSAPAPRYQFYPGDELAITVLRRPELSVRTRVDPYGYISYPYLGQVQVKDLTASEIAERLASGLQKGQYYNEPVITVALVTSAERFVYVLGEVKRPGPVATPGGLPLVAAIGAAGGQTYDAEMSTVLWIRGSQSPPGVVKLDLKAFGDPSEAQARIPNLTMIPGDVLYIPDSVIASVERFMNRMFNIIRPVVELERGLVLYPEVERFLEGDADDPRTQVIVTK